MSCSSSMNLIRMKWKDYYSPSLQSENIFLRPKCILIFSWIWEKLLAWKSALLGLGALLPVTRLLLAPCLHRAQFLGQFIIIPVSGPSLVMLFYTLMPLPLSSDVLLSIAVCLPTTHLSSVYSDANNVRACWDSWGKPLKLVGLGDVLVQHHWGHCCLVISRLRHWVPSFRCREAPLTIPTPPNICHLVAKECCHWRVQSCSCSKCSVILDGRSEDS